MLIEIHDLRKIYAEGEENEVRALDGVDLSIDYGEFVAVVGTSGSGKSTMMNILGGLDIPTYGEYLLDGIPVKERTEKKLAHIRSAKIGFIFQGYNLIPSLNVWQNVALPMLYQGVPLAERQQRAMDALAQVDIVQKAESRPTQLSGGQQQRVAIARAIAKRSPIIMADEPTGALDSKTGAQVLGILRGLNAQGTTVRLYINSEGEVETVSMPTATSGSASVATDSGSSALSRLIKELGLSGSYTIYKNGEEADAGDLEKYDVATYDAANAAILVSDRRITGVIEAVYPSMDAPQTVTVSGVEYSVLEGAQGDFSKLSLGRTVTLLLTTDAAVAAAETASSYKSDMIGVLKENSDGTYTVSLPGGLSVSGELSGGIEDRYIGTLVSLRSSGTGKISVTPVSDSDVYGRLDLTDNTLGSYDLAAGVAVYELAGRGYVTEISLDDIDWTTTVGASNVSYAHVNSAGDVDIILLEDVTGNAYTYGLASMTSGDSVFGSSTSLTVTNSAGSTGALTGADGVRAGSFIGVAYTAAGAVADTVSLSGKAVERSDFVGSEYVDVNGTLYRLADDLQVYNSTTGAWYTDSDSLGTALEQALAYSEDITVYYDRDADSGGLIRIVVVE